jgi:thiol-disulfide isomerase/thioredoxin
MPQFALDAQDCGRITLASHRGTVTLVHFFATWYEPCRRELPALDRFAARHKTQGLRVLAIDVGEVEAAVRRFLSPRPVAILVLLDTDRAVTKAWDISTLPTTFMLDETLTPGRVAAGDVDWDGPAVDQLLDHISPTHGRQHSLGARHDRSPGISQDGSRLVRDGSDAAACPRGCHFRAGPRRLAQL